MDCKQVQEQHLNDLFNQALERQIKGKLPKGYIYQLGHPNDILFSAGIPDLPIELSADRLLDKSMQENHPFDLSNVINLPGAILDPIAIFDSKTQSNSKVILTELSNGEKNFVVAIRTQKHKKSGRHTLLVNEIRSLYPRDTQQIIKWIEQSNLLKWIDKEKATTWLGKQQFNSADVAIPSSSFSITKIIQDFENPKLAEKRHIKIPSKISGTVLSQAQRTKLANGDTIQLEVIHKGVKQNVRVKMDKTYKVNITPVKTIKNNKSLNI